MPLTYNELAENLREEYPGKYSIDEWTNEALAKRFINIDPVLKDYVSDWEQLYAPDAEVRADDLQFAAYQLKEMFSSIPEWFLGSMAVVTGSKNLGELAEEKRVESAQQTEDWLAESPEVAGYLKWIEEEPVTADNWWHLEIFQRSLAQAAPSMVTMMATDLMLMPITGGIGALATKARAGKKFLDVYRGIKGARKAIRKAPKGVDIAEDVIEFTQLTKRVDRARTAGTMFSMGVYEAAGEYSEAMSYLVDEKGMDPLQAQETAAASAMIVGTINGIIEYMPYGMFKNALFTSAAKKEANSRIIRRVADSFLKDSKIAKGLARIGEGAIKQGLAEGGQEWSQHMVQQLSQFAYKHGYGDTPETAFEHFIQQATSPEAISAAHSGGSMGIIMGPFAVAGQRLLPRQREAIDDEITDIDYEGKRPPPLEPEGVTVEARLVEEEEELTKNQLIMRSFTGQKTGKLTRENQIRLENIEEELGDPSSKDPIVQGKWKEAIGNIADQDPTAFQDIEKRETVLAQIEGLLGDPLREKVEQAWEAPPVVEKAPTPAVEPTPEKAAPPIEEAPPPEEVKELKITPKQLLKKKAPVEEDAMYSVVQEGNVYKWTTAEGKTGEVRISDFKDDPITGSAKDQAYGEATAKANPLSVQETPAEGREPRAQKIYDKAFSAIEETDDPLKKLSQIQRIKNRMRRDKSDTSDIESAIKPIEEELKAQGYTISDNIKVGQKFNEGMNVIVQNIEPNEDLKSGQTRIKRIIKPQIMKDGKMVKAAEIVLEQGAKKLTISEYQQEEARLEQEWLEEEKRWKDLGLTKDQIAKKKVAHDRYARLVLEELAVEEAPAVEKPADIAPFILKDNIIEGDEILGYDPKARRFIKGDEVRSKEDYLAEQEPAEAASYDKEGEAIVGHTVFADNAIAYDNLVKIRYNPKNDKLFVRTLDGAGLNIVAYTEVQRLADPMRRFESKDDLKAEIFNRYYEVVEKLLNSGYITSETKLNLQGLKLKKDINKVSDLIPEAPAEKVEEVPVVEKERLVIPKPPDTKEDELKMKMESIAEVLEVKRLGLKFTPSTLLNAYRIGDIEVPKDLRRQGLATRLVNAKIKEWVAAGKYHFEIVAKPGSEEFWFKLGFYQTGVSEKTVKHPKTGELVNPIEMRYDFALGDFFPRTIEEAGKLARGTGQWHKARALFDERWRRSQEILKEQFPNLIRERIAIDNYMDAMEALLPDYMKDTFASWAANKFPVIKAQQWSSDQVSPEGDIAADQEKTYEVVDILLGEISESLEDLGKDLDFRFLANVNSAVNRALKLRMSNEDIAKWNQLTSRAENNTPDKWIDNTLQEATGLDPAKLTVFQRDMLKVQYHSVRSMVRTNSDKVEQNYHHNAEVIFSNGKPVVQIKKATNSKTKRANPKYEREIISGANKDIILISTNEIYNKPKSGVLRDRYDPLSAKELNLLDHKLIKTGFLLGHKMVNATIAFSVSDSKIGIAIIKDEHKSIASTAKRLEEYWKAEGKNKAAIEYLTKNGKDVSAAHIARHEARKRLYPEYASDTLPNELKRLKIAFTPSIRANNMRPVTVKLMNKENISFVYSDGKEVKGWFKPSGMKSLYAGDGGTFASKQLFRDFNSAIGVNKISRISKNVMYQVDEAGSFFVKHLMYQPQGPVQIYENYGEVNEKLIAEIREDNNIYAFPKPTAWSKKKIDDFMTEHDLVGADPGRLVDFFTDDDMHGIDGLSAAAETILDSPAFKDLNLNEKLQFIVSKEAILRKFVRKVINQSEATIVEGEEMQRIDMVMTTDEAKIATKDYADYLKTGQTFEISGQSIGIIQTSDSRHTKVKHPEQLYNYIRPSLDPVLHDLIRREVIGDVTLGVGKVMRYTRGNVQKKLADWANYLRDSEYTDNIVADYFDLGGGLHRSGAGFLDNVMQSSGIDPALNLANKPGISDKIEFDIKDELLEHELSVSTKNASIVYDAYAQANNISKKEAERKSIEDINTWLEDNEIWVLGYRNPIPHVHGAAMMRIKKVHNSGDVVFLHPNTIFSRFEGDGDGDTFYMHQMSDELTTAYRDYYNLDEIKNKLKGIDLNEFVEEDKKKYNSMKTEDIFEVINALLVGKNGIAEIGKTQRIYGQLQDAFTSIELGGVNIVLRKPNEIINTPELKKGSKRTVDEMLRIYLQASVDNAKHMLLGKWEYTSDKLRRKLWRTEGGESITDVQWDHIKVLMKKHGDTGNIRQGSDPIMGKHTVTTTIRLSNEHLQYVGYNEDGTLGNPINRENGLREAIDIAAAEGKIPQRLPIGNVVFKKGISIQEEIILQPAIEYAKYAQAGEDGSPFKLIGHHRDRNRYGGLYDSSMPNIYIMAHEEAGEGLAKTKKLLEATWSKEDIRSGENYANSMGNKFYKMYQELEKAGIDPGFLGWSNNAIMVKFIEEWMPKYEKLSENARKIATFKFLGADPARPIKTTDAKGGAVWIRNIHQLPPVSGKADGITLLEPEVMREYFDIYNETLNNDDNRNGPKKIDRSRFGGFSLMMKKKKCK